MREGRASPAFQSRPIAQSCGGGSTRVRAGIGRLGASCTLPSVPVPAWSLDRGRVLCSEPAPGAGVRAGELPRRPGCSSGDRVSWGGSCSNRGTGAAPPTPLVSGAPSLWLLAPELLCVGAGAPASHPACSGFLGLLASMSLSVKWAQGSLQGGWRCQRQLVGGAWPYREARSLGSPGGSAHPAAFCDADPRLSQTHTRSHMYTRVATHPHTPSPHVKPSSADLGVGSGCERALAF